MMSILQLFTRTHRPLTLGLLLATVLLAFLVSDAWGLLALALSAFWLMLSRRDAPRPVPSQAGAVLCPADGRVVRIEKARDPYADREALRISVFMNVFGIMPMDDCRCAGWWLVLCHVGIMKPLIWPVQRTTDLWMMLPQDGPSARLVDL